MGNTQSKECLARLSSSSLLLPPWPQRYLPPRSHRPSPSTTASAPRVTASAKSPPATKAPTASTGNKAPVAACARGPPLHASATAARATTTAIPRWAHRHTASTGKRVPARCASTPIFLATASEQRCRHKNRRSVWYTVVRESACHSLCVSLCAQLVHSWHY